MVHFQIQLVWVIVHVNKHIPALKKNYSSHWEHQNKEREKKKKRSL